MRTYLEFEGLLPSLIGSWGVQQLQRDSLWVDLGILQGGNRHVHIQEGLIAGHVVAGADFPIQIAQVLACQHQRAISLPPCSREWQWTLQVQAVH
jgi:hypothetical protein